jgi:NitT/TauT family transport system substrate-binding protein
MLAGRLSIGVMGDYPLIVNGSKFQETKSLRTLYVAGTGYNLKGAGNAIVVPVNSNFYKLEDLKGKSVSTPVGSAAWGMLIKAMQDKKMPLSSIELKNQAPAVGAANIATGKIDAHSDFCPWSEIMEHRGTGRKIYDGSETNVPICTASSCGRISPRSIRRSSSPSSRRSTTPASGSRKIRCGPRT